MKLAVNEFDHRGFGWMHRSAGEGDPGHWVFPDELPWFLSFARDGAVLADSGFADEVELICWEPGGDAEEFAIDEFVEHQFGLDTGDSWRIVF